MVFPVIMYGCESWTIKLSTEELMLLNCHGEDSWEFFGLLWRSNKSILKEISPEYSLEELRLKLKLQLPWSPDAKNWLIGKDPDAGRDWRQEEKGTTEDKMAGWHHRVDGHEFEQALGVGDGQGSLACCSPRGHRHGCATELNWTESLYNSEKLFLQFFLMRLYLRQRDSW